jgi:hypothetical protein
MSSWTLNTTSPPFADFELLKRADRAYFLVWRGYFRSVNTKDQMLSSQSAIGLENAVYLNFIKARFLIKSCPFPPYLFSAG